MMDCAQQKAREVGGADALLAGTRKGDEFVSTVMELLQAGKPFSIEAFKRTAMRIIDGRAMNLWDFCKLLYFYNQLSETCPVKALGQEVGEVARDLFNFYENVSISDLSIPKLIACFYNNSPCPGSSSGAALPHNIFAATGRYSSLMDETRAEQLIAEREDLNFDYLEGRRLKLCLGKKNNPARVTCFESYDKCWDPDGKDTLIGYMGRGREIVLHLRKTGSVEPYVFNLTSRDLEIAVRHPKTWQESRGYPA